MLNRFFQHQTYMLKMAGNAVQLAFLVLSVLKYDLTFLPMVKHTGFCNDGPERARFE